MKKQNKFAIIYLVSVFILCCAILIIAHLTHLNTDKTFIIKNNDTRDYKYEHYCDSIYEVDPDYYLDVLVETDKFQNYINEHGEWWTN